MTATSWLVLICSQLNRFLKHAGEIKVPTQAILALQNISLFAHRLLTDGTKMRTQLLPSKLTNTPKSSVTVGYTLVNHIYFLDASAILRASPKFSFLVFKKLKHFEKCSAISCYIMVLKYSFVAYRLSLQHFRDTLIVLH